MPDCNNQSSTFLSVLQIIAVKIEIERLVYMGDNETNYEKILGELHENIPMAFVEEFRTTTLYYRHV